MSVPLSNINKIAGRTALDKLLKEETTEDVHPELAELDLLPGEAAQIAEVEIYDVGNAFDKVGLADTLMGPRGCATPPPIPTSVRPVPKFFTPQSSNKSAESDIFRSFLSAASSSPPSRPASIPSLHASLTSSILTSTLVSGTQCGPGSPCSSLRESLGELTLSVKKLNRWTDARADREHELYHRLGHHHSLRCSEPPHHLHHHCPPSLSGILPVDECARVAGEAGEDCRRDASKTRAVRKKGKDAAMRERRLQVAESPRRLKPWVRASHTANLPSSSSDEDTLVTEATSRHAKKKTSNRVRVQPLKRFHHHPLASLPAYNAVPPPLSYYSLPELPASDQDVTKDFPEEKPKTSIKAEAKQEPRSESKGKQEE